MMTFFLGILEIESGRLTYCNGSHEPPYLLRGDINDPKKSDLIPLMDVNNFRLGQNSSTDYDQAEIILGSKDFILFYTDGIADIRNSSGKALGERNFIKTVLSTMNVRENPEEFIKSMNSKLNEYRNKSNLADDVTFFCVNYGGVA